MSNYKSYMCKGHVKGRPKEKRKEMVVRAKNRKSALKEYRKRGYTPTHCRKARK